MIVLGIETATVQVCCAVGGVEGVLAEFHAARGRRHAETLAPAIQFVCREASISLREVSAVAVDIGPGLFTGLRVGIATAKALAQALRVPMIGLSSLDLLAFATRYSRRTVLAAIDARRGEVYAATYRPVPGGLQRVSDYQLWRPRDLVLELVALGTDCLVVGDGALRYRALFDGDSRIELGTVGYAYPSASALVELAHPRAIREDFVQPWELAPLYLRQADAEMAWRKRREGKGAPAGWSGPTGRGSGGGEGGDGDGGVVLAGGAG
ncbi:MAG TPA: tRNA (adenosine(37)-N6)-threonylcarbamoyltransferase complex dimerization subunit type 1 TsaB [Acidimicrobiales bacterium]|nr:tRNA (adenosine(37)-N6)-threonylcarbamoyltransferase complex dimerization subunit type 1 TsaB [Acidimicrobiales bacterium]